MVEQENVITKCEDAFCFIGGGHVCRVGWLITPYEVLAMKKNALTSCISVLPKHYDNKLKPLIMVTFSKGIFTNVTHSLCHMDNIVVWKHLCDMSLTHKYLKDWLNCLTMLSHR